MREGVRERESVRGLKMPHGWLLTWRSASRTQWPPEAGKGQEQILLRSFQAELGPANTSLSELPTPGPGQHICVVFS